ncbi:imidazolonepropionase [Ktedonobacter sp. SOSP1-52]|uniref:imidazolonepropionase n=1 Tax=Ktedonobacter sp. SOSP1-52 TaxID=2778366 RepID=UPI00191519D1|nr:imidazolonepropionase [Ktedonobacter sp. SOSP1-52]GHO69121.1 imidazolonepropionase [Ktedonobacter sp. SOSP1-52]
MVLDPSQSAHMIRADTVIRNIGQLVTVAQEPLPGASGPLQVINHALVSISQGRITWIGREGEEEPQFQSATTEEDIAIIDAEGAVITPGFVDSHTHLVFAGDRAQEFHLRRAGTSYGELLARGQGILTTMNATRSADEETLLGLAQERLRSLSGYGTTTVEIKTGYGLNPDSEEQCLHIINKLNAADTNTLPTLNEVRVIPTFLGAHSVPLEYREQREAYVELVIEEMLPRFVGLARFCDVFCEREAFTLDESRRILTRAKELGYLLKLHADQLSPSGGSRLAAELGAVSADHLDHASDEDLEAMREAGVVATLLPGCSYTLRSPYPTARRFLDHGLHVALATDFNPGTSYCENMQMILGLAMSSMGMPLEEALTAATINGARALALQDEIGSIEVGKQCELALWSIQDYHEIGYHFGTNLVRTTLVKRQ